MANVRTVTLIVYYTKGGSPYRKEFSGLSRTAAKRYGAYYKDMDENCSVYIRNW